MARSFWSKRKDSINKAGSYIKETEAVSRPTAFVMTILGILVIGGLFFGVFWGARWSFEKLSGSGDNGKKSSDVAVNTPSSNPSNGTSTSKPVTETSSTSTTTPSAPKPTPAPANVPATSTNLPHTGPGSTTAFFFTVMLISYLVYRRKQLQD